MQFSPIKFYFHYKLTAIWKMESVYAILLNCHPYSGISDFSDKNWLNTPDKIWSRSPDANNALHHALDTGLTEVVRVGFHGQAVDADHRLVLLLAAPDIVFAVGPGQLQHAIGDKILARAVTFDNGFDQVLRYVLVVGQQLLCVLGQAVAAVAKTGVVVEIPDARVEADTSDDLPCVQALHLGVGIQLVKVGHAQGQVGIGEQLDGFGFGEAPTLHLIFISVANYISCS